MKFRSQKLSFVASPTGLISIAFTCLLAACGGGGGSSASSTTDISGVAAKGLVKNGVVKAYRVNADGTQSTTPESTTTTTDGKGAYTLKGMPAGVPLVIEVSPSAATKVVDETTGNDYTPSNDFTLRAAVDTTSQTANVTPFSEMAYTRAKASTGGLNASNIASANTYVAEATGVSTTSSTSTPKFDTDGKTPLNDAAVKLVAVAKLVAPTDKSVPGCESETDLARKTNCVVTQLATAAIGTLTPDTGLGQKLQNKVNEVRAAHTDIPTTVIKTPTSSSGATTSTTSPIDQVKAFFASLRSNAKALKDTGTSNPTLYTKLNDIKTDLDTRARPLNKYANNMITLVTKAYGLLNDAKNGSGPYSMTWYNSGYYYNGIYYGTDILGGCTIYQEKEQINKATSASNSNYVGCQTGPNQYDYSHWDTTKPWTQTVTGILLEPSIGNTYNVYSRTFRRTLTLVDASTNKYSEDKSQRHYLSYLSLVGTEYQGYQATVNLTKDSSGTITGIVWSGDMASSYDDMGMILGKKHTVNLNAAFERIDDHTGKIGMAGDIAIVNATDIVSSKLSLDRGSYAIGSVNQNGQDAASLQFTLSTPVWTISGKLAGSQFLADKSGLSYDPTHLEFSGSVKDANVEFFSGSMVWDVSGYANYDSRYPDSATNFAPQTFSVKGKVAITNRPTLTVDLSGTRPAFDAGNARLVYTQGADPSVTMTVSHTAGIAYSEYTAANSQGVAMAWKSTDTSTPLKRNDVTLGTADFNTSRITYTDGTFDQF